MAAKKKKKGKAKAHPGLAARALALQAYTMSPKFLRVFISMILAPLSVRAADNPAPGSPATAAPAETPGPKLTPAEAYKIFVEQMVTAENLTDLAAKMDTMIDEVDPADGSSGVAQSASHAETVNGLNLEFTVIRAPEAIMYHAGVSRKNHELLKYRDATIVFALMCDRIGLTHPIQITEGEKPVFHARWLIKPSEWKVLRKKMLEVRAKNRAEKNLFNAVTAAVTKEVNARAAASSQNKSRPW